VELPKQFTKLSVVALAENGNQQHITACIDPVGGATRSAVKPKVLAATYQWIAVTRQGVALTVLDFLRNSSLAPKCRSSKGSVA